MVWVRRDRLIILSMFIFVTFIVKSPTLSLPFYWDTFPNALTAVSINQSNLKPPVLPETDPGIYDWIHPPLYPYLLAVVLKVVGLNRPVLRSVTFIFGGIGLFYFYLLVEYLFKDRLVAALASLALFFIPQYFSFLGLIDYHVPLVTMTVICFYYLFKNEYVPYALCCAAGVLIKETFILMVPASLVWFILKGGRQGIRKRIAPIALPLAVLLIWVILLRIHHPQDFFILDEGRRLITFDISLSLIRAWVVYLYRVFIANFLFLLTIPVVAHILFLNRKWFNAETTTLLSYIAAHIGLFLFGDKLLRYMLPTYPALILLCWNSLRFFLKKLGSSVRVAPVIFTGILIVLFVTRYHSPPNYSYFDAEFNGVEFNISCGCDLVDNLNYIDSITVQQEAMKHIESYYSNQSFIAAYPFNRALRCPLFGYGEVSYELRDPWCFGGLFIYCGDIIILTSEAIPNTLLLRNYTEILLQAGEIKLVRRFERNGKYVEIYGPSVSYLSKGRNISRVVGDGKRVHILDEEKCIRHKRITEGEGGCAIKKCGIP